MPSIEIIQTESDDPNFIALLNSFVSYYADLYRLSHLKVVQIDNWFGERWLGFAGTLKGVAGIRNRSLKTRLPSPPFRPSRVISAYDFTRNEFGEYTRRSGHFCHMHTEKNGGVVWELYGSSFYCWYSGNTINNTTASLMMYDVSHEGNDAWYVQFDKRDKWSFTKSRNIAPEECQKIAKHHYASIA